MWGGGKPPPYGCGDFPKEKEEGRVLPLTLGENYSAFALTT